MDKKVRITVIGSQWDEDGMETVTEQSADAEYYEQNGSIYILYEEISNTGSEKTKNTIKIKDGVLELTKKGSVNSRMVFQEGAEHMTEYSTLFGRLQLGIRTHAIHMLKSGNTQEITIDYDLSANGHNISRCKIIIKIQNLG